MAKLTVILVMVFVLMAAGGAVFLAYYDFPAPQTPVEKVLPDARFPK
ncbi:MAG TPA: hypothetical protein VHW66_17055 [Stellaceae bacterium]|jgi:hypothetical protein|nr:hypothetical protein [Stellaceae bacterium]